MQRRYHRSELTMIVIKDSFCRSNVSSSRIARRIAFVTLIVNVSLLVIKTYAAYASGSLSIISSLVDSAVDITSGLVIWLTARAIKKRDPYLYPRGRTRLEPLALVSRFERFDVRSLIERQFQR